MATSTMRRSPGRARRSRIGVAALAAALGSATIVVATAAPAAAAEVEVQSGSLAWGVKQSLRSYVGTQLAALAQPLDGLGGGGAAPVGTRIVPFDNATFDEASASASSANAAETKAYLFPVSAADITDAENLTLDFDGGVQYWFPSHGFDIKFSDLSLVVSDGTATLVGDIAFSDVSWDGVAQGTGWTLGTPNVGNDIVIATVANASVSLGDGEVSVTASGVAFTAAAGDVFCNPVVGCLYPEGTAIDDFTVSAAYTAAPGTPTTDPTPQITLSKTSFSQDGNVEVTVTGSGFNFDPPATTSAGAPTTSSGFYVYAGKVADDWKPSEGNGSATRATVGAVSVCAWGATTSSQGCQLLLQPDGTFTATITFSKSALDTAAEAKADPSILTNYGILTVGSGGKIVPAYELFQAITFAAGAETQTITAEITHAAGGQLSWTIPNNDPVVLGAVTDHGTYLESTGAINPVTVTDTRTYQSNPWSISGQLTDFSDGTNGFDGKYLGWTPAVVAEGAGATQGGAVASGWDEGDGLKGGALLGSATDGHATGSGSLGAALVLKVPAETPSGTYTATLTLTLLG